MNLSGEYFECFPTVKLLYRNINEKQRYLSVVPKLFSERSHFTIILKGNTTATTLLRTAKKFVHPVDGNQYCDEYNEVCDDFLYHSGI